MINRVREDIRGQERVAIRLPRGGGKTISSLEWILDNCKGKHVGYVRNHYPTPDMACEYFGSIGRRIQVERITHSDMVLCDGTKITFLSPSDNRRGRRFDALVFDEFGTMAFEETVAFMADSRYNKDLPICITYSKLNKNMKSLLGRMDSVAPLHKVTYDCLDMVEHGLIRPETVRDLMQGMGKKEFAQCYGPYYEAEDGSEHRSNAFFRPLLERP